MSNGTKRRCAQCGERAVAKVKQAGRVRTYKNVDLEVPADVEIPTCETVEPSGSMRLRPRLSIRQWRPSTRRLNVSVLRKRSERSSNTKAIKLESSAPSMCLLATCPSSSTSGACRADYSCLSWTLSPRIPNTRSRDWNHAPNAGERKSVPPGSDAPARTLPYGRHRHRLSVELNGTSRTGQGP
jgi:hypothetical protein